MIRFLLIFYFPVFLESDFQASSWAKKIQILLQGIAIKIYFVRYSNQGLTSSTWNNDSNAVKARIENHRSKNFTQCRLLI